MRATETIITTLREAPSDAVAVSHCLMLRAGLVHKLGAGLYHWLPLGLRVLRKIEAIVREEMDAVGALEFQLPILCPAELWQRSQRWELMGKELFRLQDRHTAWNLLGPTHEEPFTALMSRLVSSYKDLPKNVYQIHTKFRDEIRPRFGVIRSREFIMKDAYSFHINEECLDETYQKMRQAYRRIFSRVGLKTISVEADTGNMGGAASEEFMVAAEIGEETLLVSENDTYRANCEKTPVLYDDAIHNKGHDTQAVTLQKLHTPNLKSIADIAKKLKVAPDHILKAVLYLADEKPVVVFIRADRDVNMIKLKNYLSSTELRIAEAEEATAMGFVVGFIGPLHLQAKTEPLILWDASIKTRGTWIVGANMQDYHYQGFQLDLEREVHDFALARAGDPAPNGDGKLKEKRGIEVGHIFKLGRKYTNAFDMQVLDKNSQSQTPYMGCYGIGVDRTMATIIEQCHDEKGICWPSSVAPYEVVLISITTSAVEMKVAEQFYYNLQAANCEVLWDDRNLRPGVKFYDAELIGFPIRITMGKRFFQSGELELQVRSSGENLVLQGTQEELCRQVLAIREKFSIAD